MYTQPIRCAGTFPGEARAMNVQVSHTTFSRPALFPLSGTFVSGLTRDLDAIQIQVPTMPALHTFTRCLAAPSTLVLHRPPLSQQAHTESMLIHIHSNLAPQDDS